MVRRLRRISRLRALAPAAAALAASAALAALPAPALAAATAAKAKKKRPAAPAAVPQGFVGVDADGPLTDPAGTVNFDDQLGTMVASGVQTIRVAFSWAAAQPYAAESDVPAGQASEFTEVAGVPTDFQATDTIVGDAARHHVGVLPTVLYVPAWDELVNHNPDGGFDMPLRDGPYANYLTALIGRYGPHGTFWSQHPTIPKLPIRAWQIWNEPNLGRYWSQPFASTYVALLRASHTAIKRADPGAHVVLGALTNSAWASLASIYRIKGARSLFDEVSVNAFTKLPSNVIRYLSYVRGTMKRFGDKAKPLLATELSWPSAVGSTTVHFDFDTTRSGQARNLATLLPLLGRDRTSLGLAGFDWYTWMGEEFSGAPEFDFAGLLAISTTGQVTAKPALTAFRTAALALEGCKGKGAVATSCLH